MPAERPASGSIRRIFKRYFPEDIRTNFTPAQLLIKHVEILVKNISNLEKSIPVPGAFPGRLMTGFLLLEERKKVKRFISLLLRELNLFANFSLESRNFLEYSMFQKAPNILFRTGWKSNY